MLSRIGLLAALMTALCAAWLPAPAGAVAADGIRNNQHWVLGMLHVPQAWSRADGAGVIVAVIDSGVNSRVSDLAGSVIPGPDYTGVRTAPSSTHWGVHGTWMASLVAGHGHGGGSGVIGVAPRSRVLAIRVIPDRDDPHYRQYSREPENRIQGSLAAGIDYAVAHGAQVISMSIGYNAPSGTVKRALQRAYDHGVVVVASAGNSGDVAGAGRAGHAPDSFPAEYPGVIGVSAVDSAGVVAGFSSENLSVQVAAPGVSVPAQGRDGQYWWVSGTSPACALIAGVAALIKSAYPGLAPHLVASAMTSTTTERPASGYDNRVGFGIVNAAAALTRAGQLSRDRPVATGVAATTQFRGSAVAEPVGPRGQGQLVLYTAAALASLTLAGTAARLMLSRRTRR